MKIAMLATGLVVLWAAAPAHAVDNPMKVCGAKFRAAKKANQLPPGQTWPQFLSACRGGLAKPAAAAATPSKAAPAGPSASQLAARDREKTCGAQWRADKAAGKVAAGQTWPKYWSACNARLKS